MRQQQSQQQDNGSAQQAPTGTAICDAAFQLTKWMPICAIRRLWSGCTKQHVWAVCRRFCTTKSTWIYRCLIPACKYAMIRCMHSAHDCIACKSQLLQGTFALLLLEVVPGKHCAMPVAGPPAPSQGSAVPPGFAAPAARSNSGPTPGAAFRPPGAAGPGAAALPLATHCFTVKTL